MRDLQILTVVCVEIFTFELNAGKNRGVGGGGGGGWQEVGGSRNAKRGDPRAGGSLWNGRQETCIDFGHFDMIPIHMLNKIKAISSFSVSHI